MRRLRTSSTAVLAAAVLACVSACAPGPAGPAAPGGATVSTAGADPTAGAGGGGTRATPDPFVSPSPTSTPASPSTTTAQPSAAPAPAAVPPPAGVAPGAADVALPVSIGQVGRGDVVRLRIRRGASVILDARSSGLARYNTSASCEVPGQPCYDAPTLDKVARIDLGSAPQVPGTQTTFITGHSNRYHPDDATRGVFSRLQEVRTGDEVVVWTTAGVFVYAVTTALSVPFDQLTTTDQVVRVRRDTLVAISCVIAPDHSAYLGNYVVVGTLRASAPA